MSLQPISIVAEDPSTGLPLSGLTPTWYALRDAGTNTDVPSGDRPSIVEMGTTGQYLTGVQPQWAGIIDFGATAARRYVDVGGGQFNTWMVLSSSTGAPLPGQAVAVLSARLAVDGSVYPAPALSELAHGLYLMAAAPDDVSVTIDNQAGALPRLTSWLVGADGVVPVPPVPYVAPPPVVVPIAQSLTVDYEEDWQLRLQGRIYVQFRGLPVITALSDLIARQTQDLEDAIQSLLSVFSIGDVGGVNLQRIGRIVGQPFRGEPDATFRLYLFARVRANRSSGEPEDLYAVFNAMFGNAAPGQAQVVAYPPSPAALVFRVIGFPLDPVQAAVLFELLNAATVGGVRIELEWAADTDDVSFAWDETAPGLPLGDAADPSAEGGVLAGSLTAET